MKIKLNKTFKEIVSIENLLLAWQEFECGKKNKKDVQEFSMHLMNNIFSLHNELLNHTYKHSSYQAFKINDPKPRDIHKAKVRDRLLHHAVYRILYPFFDKTFISDSYSCRNEKGTHKAIGQFREYFYAVSKNNTKTCYVLKCDIKKFFANIDHGILLNILSEYILDKNILWLLGEVIESFTSPGLRPPSPCKGEGDAKVGLPLGNLTSQLFVNVYMNKFDQFVKHKLKTKHYIRYADDFVILHQDKKYLKSLIAEISEFLENNLKLSLHPDKVFLQTSSSGVDFLGMINFPKYKILRTKTKRRMLKKIYQKRWLLWEELVSQNSFEQSLQSYLGMLGHCEGYKILKEIEKDDRMKS